MTNKITLERIRPAIRVALGLVLLVAGLSKLTHLADFVEAFSVIPQLGWSGWRSLAMLIPAAELVIGLRLIVKPGDEPAAGLSVAMFALFLGYQLLVAQKTGLFGRPASNCPCFTFGSTETSPQYVYILRNSAFLGLAMAAFPLSRIWRRPA